MENKGEQYEKFVGEVLNFYQRDCGKRKDFVIKRNFSAKDLPNIDDILENKSEKEKAKLLNTEIADVYFSYMDDNNNKIETYVECKSGKFNQKDLVKKFILKLKKFNIDYEKINKMLVYEKEDEINEEIKCFCNNNNIELKQIRIENDSPIQSISLTNCLFFKNNIVYGNIITQYLKIEYPDGDSLIFNNNAKTFFQNCIPKYKRLIWINNENNEKLYETAAKISKEQGLDFIIKNAPFFGSKKDKNDIEIKTYCWYYPECDKIFFFLAEYKVMFTQKEGKIGMSGIDGGDKYNWYIRKPIGENKNGNDLF